MDDDKGEREEWLANGLAREAMSGVDQALGRIEASSVGLHDWNRAAREAARKLIAAGWSGLCVACGKLTRGLIRGAPFCTRCYLANPSAQQLQRADPREEIACPEECPAGMVLDVDPYDPSGETPGLPRSPARRYRCRDCGRTVDPFTAVPEP